jgi:hypothetical protein
MGIPNNRLLMILGLLTLVLLVLLNVFRMADVIAHAAGYNDRIPMFKPDMTINYSPDTLYEILAEYGEAGRRIYTILLLSLDVAFPLLYGSFLYLAIKRIYSGLGASPVWVKVLGACPLLAMACDLSENVSLAWLMHLYPQVDTTLARVANVFTLSKWGFSLLSVVCVLIGLAVSLFHRFQARVPQE